MHIHCVTRKMNRKEYTWGGLLETPEPLGNRFFPLMAKELNIPPEDLRNQGDSDNWQVLRPGNMTARLVLFQTAKSDPSS